MSIMRYFTARDPKLLRCAEPGESAAEAVERRDPHQGRGTGEAPEERRWLKFCN